MNWIAKPTGDMTLSILNEDGQQILKVDMLSSHTMQVGTNGNLLVQTLNDLSVIANFSRGIYDISPDVLPFDIGISARPWSASYDEKKRKLIIKSTKGKIAERIFPAKFTASEINRICDCIFIGIQKVNEQ